MSLSVKENREGQVLVLSPQGRLDSANAREFQALVMGHIDGGEENMIVDLSNLDYISSAGIRVMRLASKGPGGVRRTIHALRHERSYQQRVPDQRVRSRYCHRRHPGGRARPFFVILNRRQLLGYYRC